ncbi:MAG: acetate--CoA ligase family protein, partial [Acidimicrobiales bacterium]
VEPPTPAPAAATRAARLAAARFLARRPEGGWLAPDELAELLGAYGIALPPSEAVWLVGGSADDAAVAAAAARVGRAGGAAVAVKALGSTILHKSDVGGVLLGVAPADAAAAARGLRARLGAALEGVLVQAMAPPGVETIVGAVHDEQFGPLVMFGLGGVAAELFADRSFRLAPLSRPDAAELVRAPKSAALLFGWRNAPAVDAAALEALLEAVGWLAADVPELAELDLNPVLARPDGITVVDARARLASHAPLPALPVRRIE